MSCACVCVRVENMAPTVLIYVTPSPTRIRKSKHQQIIGIQPIDEGNALSKKARRLEMTILPLNWNGAMGSLWRQWRAWSASLRGKLLSGCERFRVEATDAIAKLITARDWRNKCENAAKMINEWKVWRATPHSIRWETTDCCPMDFGRKGPARGSDTEEATGAKDCVSPF
jgi:hypothetical protein